MEYNFTLAGILICLRSERPLKIEKEWELFRHSKDEKPDLLIDVSWDWEHRSVYYGEFLGKDLLHCYYEDSPCRFCISEEGKKEAAVQVSYDKDLTQMVCRINEMQFLTPPDSVGRIMRALPLREILLHFSTLLFHASRIAYESVGMIFCAPSGTGKTTQAELWERWMGAKILCNDRTLVRKRGEAFLTYGMPLDGSKPVGSAQCCTLGAVILLRQGKENRVQRLMPIHAVSKMMEQVVMDWWNPEFHEKTMEFLFYLAKKVPVYQLICTPDQNAVEVLYKKLQKEGILKNG